MKKAIESLTALILLFLISSFSGSDLMAQETRDLDPFTGIGIAISADVFYTPGNSHEIRIEGNSKDVKDLVTKVENGYLKLKYDDWKMKRSKLTIYITSKELDKVGLSGSGDFKSEKPVRSEEITIAISGSGTVLFTNLEAEEVDVKISGSGDVILEKGRAEEVDVKISGSGNVLAEYFETSEFSAGISGSGSVRITVQDELETRISGSGSIYYHGTPQLNTTSSGSGKVRSL
jgi:hypothetical protein